MCWIDYRKAYYMVPHSWIMECLTMFKIATNVQNFLQDAMPLWKVEQLQITKILQGRNKTRNTLRRLPIASTIHNRSHLFNAHSKKL